MAKRIPSAAPERRAIPKAATGISGLDNITAGGPAAGRPTLIAGGPGCGKTIFGLEFLVRGALERNEPGVLVSFEETESELVANARALGFDLPRLTANKRLFRVVKYRGSSHGTNEYPFLIGNTGISVLPITSLGLHHSASTTRVSAGLPSLDVMLGGGYFKGSSVLISGTPRSGKTSLAAHFVQAACQRHERCLYCAFEESPAQIARNMRSIRAAHAVRHAEADRWRRELRRKEVALEARIAALRAEFEAERDEYDALAHEETARERKTEHALDAMERIRAAGTLAEHERRPPDARPPRPAPRRGSGRSTSV